MTKVKAIQISNTPKLQAFNLDDEFWYGQNNLTPYTVRLIPGMMNYERQLLVDLPERYVYLWVSYMIRSATDNI